MSQREQFFLIRCTEDGYSIGVHDTEESTAEAFAGVVQAYPGTKVIEEDDSAKCWKITDEMEHNLGVLIIRGTVVTPEPVEVVRRWKMKETT